MANKRSKIELLREKINIMEKDLKLLQQIDTNKSIDKSLSKNGEAKSGNRNHSKEILNQTARYARPLYRPDREALYQERARQAGNHRRESKNIVRNLSPGLKDIINHIDEQYYKKKPAIDSESASQNSERNLYQSSFIGRRYQHTIHTESRSSIKQTYRKMFEHKKTDLILNPEQHNEGGIKIVKKLDRSPDHMLTQNPKSNPNLYFYKDKTVPIENRGCLNAKNKSSLTFDPSIGEMTIMESTISPNQRPKSQKKHFSRYVQDILKSKIIDF